MHFQDGRVVKFVIEVQTLNTKIFCLPRCPHTYLNVDNFCVLELPSKYSCSCVISDEVNRWRSWNWNEKVFNKKGSHAFLNAYFRNRTKLHESKQRCNLVIFICWGVKGGGGVANALFYAGNKCFPGLQIANYYSISHSVLCWCKVQSIDNKTTVYSRVTL